MPRTVEEGFRDFLSYLTPSATESNAARSHRASIEATLKANFDLKRFFRTGSFGNGTSISGYSDVDYFADIPREKLKQNSGTTLTQVRDVLDKRFPNSGVRASCPAIVVPFGTLARETTEVVPADYIMKTADSYLVYEIADCSGGWMRSSPDTHNAYIRELDQKLEGKVKPLIRFIKAWKCYRRVPISSFYLELRVAKYCEGQSAIVYDWDVERILSKLEANGLAQMQDPKGISGYISPCRTQAQLEDARSKLSTARVRAEKALAARRDGKVKEAFEWWDLLYDGKFSSYYR